MPGTKTGRKRPRLTEAERQERYAQALSRAEGSASLTNYPAIFEGFIQKGVPVDQIRPRENVLTFAAWKSKGRSVRKGEKGVRVVTVIQAQPKQEDGSGSDQAPAPYSIPSSTYVFHISQTDPIERK